MLVKDKIDDNFLYYFNEGKCTNAHEVFGAHVVKNELGEYIGCEFTLYAPNAKEVSIIAEWNGYQGFKDKMELIDESGIWYLHVPGDLLWKRYKFCITTKQGELKYKADPYAFYSDMRPSTDSKVTDIDGYVWHDEEFLKNKTAVYDKPVMVYEMHLGSWMKNEEGLWYEYQELASKLTDYLVDMKYTHVEFMPVYEFPLDASWGYMGTGYFSPTSRFGSPKSLMYLIDTLHQAGIAVIFDWVPGHICKDAHGLYMFDGTALYDYKDDFRRENPEWGTANLDLGKGITRSFLYSNAAYFMDYFHCDGFRVDAVSNIIYYHGNKNLGQNQGGIDFLRDLSRNVFAKDDKVLLMAEDSSDFDGVTRSVDQGGLGFNYKWDMGWMNDTLKYFKLDPVYRKYHHHQLTFSMVYNYNEKFILPFSHDEVVHMKGSLVNKMPGDYWQKFANYRLLIGYMMTHPGKKLLFMGNELAQFSEWNFNTQLDWNLLDYPKHSEFKNCMSDMILFYRNEKSLFEEDHSSDGFKWIEANNAEQSVYIYSRYAKDRNNHLVVVMNATPNTFHNYRIGVPTNTEYFEVFNTDEEKYGGSGQVNLDTLACEEVSCHSLSQSISITVPPLGISILKPMYNGNVDANVSELLEEADLSSLTKKELLETAKLMNLPTKSSMTKSDIIKLINK